jgi:hypothetical protein
VVERAVLPGEVDPPLGAHDVGLQRRLLLRREERKRAVRVAVVVPGVRGADLVDVANPQVDAWQEGRTVWLLIRLVASWT